MMSVRPSCQRIGWKKLISVSRPTYFVIYTNFELCHNTLHEFLWYRVVSVTNHKSTFIIVTNRLCSVYLFVSTSCLYVLFCHHDASQEHHRLISSFTTFGSHRIAITTYHHLMLCRDCQEPVASARCQDSTTVILFQPDISTHPFFLRRYALF